MRTLKEEMGVIPRKRKLGFANPAYTRQWEIIDEDGMKRIIVVVTSNMSFVYGTPPSTTIVTQKAP